MVTLIALYGRSLFKVTGPQDFSPQSVPLGSLGIILKYFRIWFRTRRDIREYASIPLCPISGQHRCATSRYAAQHGVESPLCCIAQSRLKTLT
jgi:hypothetical protein